MTGSSILLAENPYGNYAIQIVLQTFPKECTNSLIESLKGKIVQLSMIKYSSNVVERSMENAVPELRDAIINELMESDNFLGIFPYI